MPYYNLTSGKFESSRKNHLGYGMYNKSYFGLMRIPNNFLLGQLSSPTTGIFPGQAPAVSV